MKADHSDVARVALLLFAAAWGANHFAPLLLVYRVRLQLSPTDLAVLFGVYAVGLVPGLFFGGPLSDRRGRRTVVLPSACLALAGTILLAMGSAGFLVLLAGRLVVGIGSGATFSAGTAWIADLSARDAAGTGARRAAVALSSGFGGGPLIAGVIAQWSPQPMLVPYLVQAAFLLLAIVLASQVPASAPAAIFRGPAQLRLLPRGFFKEVAPTAPWVFTFAAIAFVVLPGLVRERAGGFAVVYAGMVTAVTLLAGVAVQPFLRKTRPRLAATLGLAIGSVGLMVGMVATAGLSLLGVFLAAVLLGTGYGACLIAGLRWIEAATVPAIRGRVTGLFYVFTYLGFAAPFLLAACAPWLGDRASLACTAAVALATAGYSARHRWHNE
ncbi:MAG TPA: MFS transporter [Polyangia bacterium]|nr:MFS transporter [Polyangia bacterium]